MQIWDGAKLNIYLLILSATLFLVGFALSPAARLNDPRAGTALVGMSIIVPVIVGMSLWQVAGGATATFYDLVTLTVLHGAWLFAVIAGLLTLGGWARQMQYWSGQTWTTKINTASRSFILIGLLFGIIQLMTAWDRLAVTGFAASLCIMTGVVILSTKARLASMRMRGI